MVVEPTDTDNANNPHQHNFHSMGSSVFPTDHLIQNAVSFREDRRVDLF